MPMILNTMETNERKQRRGRWSDVEGLSCKYVRQWGSSVWEGGGNQLLSLQIKSIDNSPPSFFQQVAIFPSLGHGCAQLSLMHRFVGYFTPPGKFELTISSIFQGECASCPH